jgi:8-amino-7-oxononanoate synthase
MEHIIDELQQIKAKGLYRELSYMDAAQEPHTVIEGRKMLLLASNSYLGLSNDARLKAAALEAIEQYGVGSGGSRLTSGSYRLHQELEQRLAEFKGTESCLVFNTGYMANLGTIAGLADRDWVIFCDRLNHASIIDGCRLSGAKLIIYKHCDIGDLHKKIQRYRGTRNLLVTDGVFSMDGDLAPLPELAEVAAEKGLFLMVDDAHATGVLGPHGAGTADYFGLPGKVAIQMGTLSKALAGEGGYIAGKRVLIDYLRQRAKSFIYSTALAPQTIAVALRALKIIRDEPERRVSLLAKAAWFKNELTQAGLKIPHGNTPIIPVLVGASEIAVQFSLKLREAGIYVPAVRPPTVPEGTGRLRISLMATHTEEDLRLALEKIIAIGAELGLNESWLRIE